MIYCSLPPRAAVRPAVLGSVALCLLVGAASCASVARGPRVGVHVEDVALIDVSFTDIAMSATTEVHNGGSQPVHIDEWQWSLTVDRGPSWTGVVRHPVDIAPGGQTTTEIPVAFHLRSEAAGSGERAYHLRLGPAGMTARPAVYDGRFRLPDPPRVVLTAFTVRALAWQEATVQADIDLTSPAGERYRLRELDCTVALDGRPLLRMRTPRLDVPLAPHAVVPLAGHIPLGPAGQATAAILRRQVAEYHLTGHALIDAPGFGDLLLPLDAAGSVEIGHAEGPP